MNDKSTARDNLDESNPDNPVAPSNPNSMEGDPAAPFQSNPEEAPTSTPENPPQPPPVEEGDSEEDSNE